MPALIVTVTPPSPPATRHLKPALAGCCGTDLQLGDADRLTVPPPMQGGRRKRPVPNPSPTSSPTPSTRESNSNSKRRPSLHLRKAKSAPVAQTQIQTQTDPTTATADTDVEAERALEAARLAGLVWGYEYDFHAEQDEEEALEGQQLWQ